MFRSGCPLRDDGDYNEHGRDVIGRSAAYVDALVVELGVVDVEDSVDGSHVGLELCSVLTVDEEFVRMSYEVVSTYLFFCKLHYYFIIIILLLLSTR